MTANELRIGNWVNDFAYQVQGEDSIPDIYGLTEVVENIDLFNPIPLTEEWLERFGFEVDAHGYKFGVRMYVRVYLGDRMQVHHVDPRDMRFTQPTSIASPKYVHSLQNLYFALTGEELQIKEHAS